MRFGVRSEPGPPGDGVGVGTSIGVHRRGYLRSLRRDRRRVRATVGRAPHGGTVPNMSGGEIQLQEWQVYLGISLVRWH